MIDTMLDFSKIIIADLILSGDNALIIGVAAAGLSPELRKKAILFGMVIAALMRIVFAIIATQLLKIQRILLAGALLLFWVCWRLFQDILEGGHEQQAELALATADNLEAGYTGPPRRTLLSALISITIADVSMSLDNGRRDRQRRHADAGLRAWTGDLADGVCRDHDHETSDQIPWISWLGPAVVVDVAVEMFHRGFFDAGNGVGPLLGLVEGYDLSKH